MEVNITEFQRGRSLRLVCSVMVLQGRNETTQSPKYDVGQMATVYFTLKKNDQNVTATVLVKRHEALKDQNVEITVNCNDKMLRINCTDDRMQQVTLGEYKPDSQCSFVNLYVLRINIVSYIIDKPTYTKFYEDGFENFTIAAGESLVHVHKSVLAATSEVFKDLLRGEWEGKDKGCLDVKGVTQKTLEHFKKYIYYGELPEHEDLQPLLLIAKCYEIGALEQVCADKLARTVKGEKLIDMLEFAVDNHQMELIFSMLQITPNWVVDAACKVKYEKANRKTLKVENEQNLKVKSEESTP